MRKTVWFLIGFASLLVWGILTASVWCVFIGALGTSLSAYGLLVEICGKRYKCIQCGWRGNSITYEYDSPTWPCPACKFPNHFKEPE